LREPRLRIDRDDAMQILRALDHDCDVHVLCAVPAPRARRDAACSRQIATVAPISSTECGSTGRFLDFA